MLDAVGMMTRKTNHALAVFVVQVSTVLGGFGALASCSDEPGSSSPHGSSGTGGQRDDSGGAVLDASAPALDGTVTSDARKDALGAYDATKWMPDAAPPDAASICTTCSVEQLALGGAHSCALMNTGAVACWGDNAFGQLGDGNGGGTSCGPVQTCGNRYSSYPVLVAGLTDAVQIGAGTFHTCAVRATGQVVCWGMMGNAAAWNTKTLTPVAIAGITDAVHVAGGLAHTCVTRASGKVSCWGIGPGGKTGSPSADTPPTVIGVADAVQTVGGRDHTCARLAGGGVQCWGANNYGALGDGLGGAGGPGPVAVLGLTDATHISATAAYGDGEGLSCAVRATGEVVCWGRGACPAGSAALAPQLVAGVAGAVEVGAVRKAACARLATGEVSCWGPTLFACGAQTLAGLTDVVHLASSVSHWCALRATGEVMCWGNNDHSQLGNGTFTNTLTPVQVGHLP